MCGIFGHANRRSTLISDVLARQLDTLVHRGPDDSGLWLRPDGRLALGSRRLAIIDLSPAGHMPMRHHTAAVWIVFNGEIYNFQTLRQELAARGYHFRSRTDTEVILAAYLEWGTDCLQHLNGMFGLAIYDEREAVAPQGRLFLARDRAGEKPLYYHLGPDSFVFASELKALMADPHFPRHLDRVALNAYLAMGYVPGALCILEGVQKLPPAHALLYDCAAHRLQMWPYWSVPDPAYDLRADADALVDQLESLLLESVRQRLVADVPVGVFLSGGIDSSLVTALAARASPAPIKTFTITFPGYASADESRRARRVAEWLRTEHVELAAEPATVDLMPHLMRFYDEPLADTSIIPTYLVSKLTRAQVTVALGGDGGDELFGGYRHYRRVLRRQQIVTRVPQPVRSLAARCSALLPVGQRGRSFLSGIRGGLAENMVYSVRAGFFDPAARRLLLNGLHSGQPETDLLASWPGQGQAVDQMTRLDFASYLPDDVLVKVDRASMAVSLETRAPWLDQQVMEFAFQAVPHHLKIDDHELKILPRRLARRLLPPDLDIDRKQGFGLPVHEWLRGVWRPLVVDTVHGLDRQVFNPVYVERLLADHDRGVGNAYPLFALLVFGLWQQQYGVSLA